MTPQPPAATEPLKLAASPDPLDVVRVLRDAALDFTLNTGDTVMDEQYFEEQARRQLAALEAAGLSIPVLPAEVGAWPEYEVRTPDGEHAVQRDDVGDAVDFQRQVWPDATIRQRTVTRIYGAWTEVTE
jgi:hypothetical protein